MNAKDLAVISEEITNSEKLDRVYNEILLPQMKRIATSKRRVFEITDNRIPAISDSVINEHLKNIGIKGCLQSLVQEEMRPYLEAKGFEIRMFSPSYLVEIHW